MSQRLDIGKEKELFPESGAFIKKEIIPIFYETETYIQCSTNGEVIV